MPDSDFIEFHEETAGENAKKIVEMAVRNFKNRRPELVNIPKLKTNATVGYSVEAIKKCLDGVTNSHVDELGTTKPLIDCVKSGVLRGAVAMVGCNNPKVRPDYAHINLMKKLIANDIIVIVSGCSAQAAAKAGLMSKEAKNLCGEGLKRVCELVDIPPILHMGSCVDISRMMILAADIAKDWGIDICQFRSSAARRSGCLKRRSPSATTSSPPVSTRSSASIPTPRAVRRSPVCCRARSRNGSARTTPSSWTSKSSATS